METIVVIGILFVISIIWSLVKAGSRAAYRKITEPSDTLRKVERDADYASKAHALSDTEASMYKDVQRLGVCFARLALSVGFADGELQFAEISSIISFFSGADPSFKEHIAKMIQRDLSNPQSIDWQHNRDTLVSLLNKERFRGFDAIVFDGLLNISASDGEISSTELNTIFAIMNEIGWSNEKISAYFNSRFGYFKDDNSDRDQRKMDAYKVLDLSEYATVEEIRSKYRELAKRFHPDVYASMGSAAQRTATERFQTIKEAYELLMTEFTPSDTNNATDVPGQETTYNTSTSHGARWKCPQCWIMNSRDQLECANCGFSPS